MSLSSYTACEVSSQARIFLTSTIPLVIGCSEAWKEATSAFDLGEDWTSEICWKWPSAPPRIGDRMRNEAPSSE